MFTHSFASSSVLTCEALHCVLPSKINDSRKTSRVFHNTLRISCSVTFFDAVISVKALVANVSYCYIAQLAVM